MSRPSSQHDSISRTLQCRPESVSVENLTEVFRCALVIFEDSPETLANWSEDFFGSGHSLKYFVTFLTYFKENFSFFVSIWSSRRESSVVVQKFEELF